MIFKKIRWKNLLSTGNQWTELELNKNKTTLIVGKNGAGKSTVLDAISFALFNKPFRPGFNLPQLVNSINGKHCTVELEFSIGRKEYKIVRGLKPRLFEIYEDDTIINQDAAARDYQDYLEKHILKFNHQSFTQIVIIGTANFTPFMRLKPQHRREIIESLLDLTIFSLMNSLLFTKKQQNDMAIERVQNDKKLLAQKVELIEKHSREISENTQSIIDDKKSRIDGTKSRIEEIEGDISQCWMNLNDLKKQCVGKDKALEAQTKIIGVVARLTNRIKTLKEEIEFFNANEDCPTCSQKIEEQFKQTFIAKNQELIEAHNGNLQDILKKKKIVETRLTLIATLERNISELHIKITRDESSVSHLKDYIQELEKEIMSLGETTQQTDTSELEKIEKEKEALEERYNSLSKRRQMLDVSGTLLKDTGIKAKIIKKHIPIINKLINKYLGMMDFFCQFTINENFEEKILSRYREEFTYASFSEGEKFRINLALLFTWRAVAKLRNSINTNILFMDEVFESSLDMEGMEEFFKIINEKEAENIFILSPKGDHLFDKFEHTIRFEKTKNFSRIVSQ